MQTERDPRDRACLAYHYVSDRIRLLLILIPWLVGCQLGLNPVRLLDDMCKLVSQQSLPRSRVWLVLPGPKYHIAPDRIGYRINCPRRLRRLRIAMRAHVTEFMPEARLHKPAR